VAARKFEKMFNNKRAIKHALPSLTILSIILTLAFHTAAASANISIVGPVTVDPSTIRSPGSSAYNFRPAVATVAQGGQVVWTNRGIENHTVTSYSTKAPFSFEGFTIQLPVPDGNFDSLGTVGPVVQGQSYTLDTSKLAPGNYHYFCQFHPWMQAVLTIKPSSSTTSTTTPQSTTTINIDHNLGKTTQYFAGSASWGFLPGDLAVKKGEQVIFTNTAVIPHTVTSYTDTVQFPISNRLLTSPIPDGTFDSLTISPNGIQAGATFTLDTHNLNTGTYHYFCDFHPWMQGTLTVT